MSQPVDVSQLVEVSQLAEVSQSAGVSQLEATPTLGSSGTGSRNTERSGSGALCAQSGSAA